MEAVCFDLPSDTKAPVTWFILWSNFSSIPADNNKCVSSPWSGLRITTELGSVRFSGCLHTLFSALLHIGMWLGHLSKAVGRIFDVLLCSGVIRISSYLWSRSRPMKCTPWTAPIYKARLNVLGPSCEDALSLSRRSCSFCLTRGPIIRRHYHSNFPTHNTHVWLHNNRRYVITIGDSSILWKRLSAGTAGLVVANRLTEDPKIPCWFWRRVWGKWVNDATIIPPSLLYHFPVTKESSLPLRHSFQQCYFPVR